MELDKHLIELSNTPGVTGYEAPVRDLIARTWQPLADSLRIDPMGSLVATIYGTGAEPRPRILVTAHMDEIGLMVTHIKDGFVNITSVGGIDKRVLPGQPVVIHGEKLLPGLIGTRPPHVVPSSEHKNYPAIDELVVDTGLSQKQLEKLVRIGDIVSFDIEACELSDGLITGKAMDNRASVACMTRLLEHLQNQRPLWDVVIGATVQEEIGAKMGELIAWSTQPDLAIVVDTTWAIGVGVSEEKGFKLSGGPTLALGAEVHMGMYNALREIGQDLEIKFNPEVITDHSGTEARYIHITRAGIPTAVIYIPIRNMHMPIEVVATIDIERTARLIAAFIASLDIDSAEEFSQFFNS